MPNQPEKIFQACIKEDMIFGERCKVVMPSNLYGGVLGDDCFVGPFVEIQKGVKIGSRTRIQSHSFVCELVEIGEDCFIGHGTAFINDKFSVLGRPAYIEREFWKPTKIGNRVVIGNNATILPVKICDDVIIGAGAVVTKDIDLPGIYAGNPAKYLKPFPEKPDSVKFNRKNEK